ncbi:MAG TPA: hypothetical protein VF553_16275 [Pyrinomonadaceae bacterium]|jgi:hypothetical protein
MNRFIHHRYRLTDLFLLLYLVAVVRQFFWGIDQQLIAWALTATVSALALLAHATFREEAPEGFTGKLSWVAYSAPLLLIFFLRSPFPDHNFDVLNYHLAHMERALRGWPFMPGDFLPTSIQFNPLPDMVAGISKYLLGHRLGPLINTGAMLWTALIAEQILKQFISNKYFLRLASIVVISTELVLYLLSTYLVDLLALPLLLEATCLALNFKKISRKNYTLIHVGLFLGIALAMKLTNLAFVIPIAGLTLYNAYRERASLRPRAILGGTIAALAPAAPFTAYMIRTTGSPVFPFYNKLFRSVLWLPNNISDPINGPKNIIETVLWPLWVYLYPERGSEFSGAGAPYTGRIALGFIFAFVGLLAPQVKESTRQLAAMTLCAMFLWSASTGNLRYGLFLEVLSGVLIISVLVSLLEYYRKLGTVNPYRVTALALCFAVVIGMQVLSSYRQAATLDQCFFGDKVQSTVFQEPRSYLREAAYFLDDRNALSFLPAEQQTILSGVDVWINAYPTTSGLMASLKPTTPMISVTPFLPTIDVFDPLRTRAGLEAYRSAMNQVRGKRLYTLTHKIRLNETLKTLERAGLTPVRVTDMQMPFYSVTTGMKVALIEVEFHAYSREPSILASAH